MAAFVQWLAPHYDVVLKTLPQELITLRAAAVQTAHRRTPELIANLALGWHYFLACAHDLGVLSATECEQFWGWAWRTLGEVGNAQQAHQADDDPVARFLALLRGALTAGLAHVQDARRYGPPPDPQDWGWTVRERTTPADAYQEWTPHGACIGYLDDTRLYLEPEASYSVVQRIAETQRAPLAISQRTLHGRMHEQGLLLTQPSQSQKTVSKRVGPAQALRRVLDLAVSTLVPSYQATNSNFSNNSNAAAQLQQNQSVELLLFPSWHAIETVTGRGETVTASERPGTGSSPDTGSVTVSQGLVTVSKTVMAPQLIENKDRLLLLLKLLFESEIEGTREGESSRVSASLTDEVTI